MIDLCTWDAVYFVGPNCFQHLRRDHTLQDKINDGRAFWGAAMVLWCLCCPYARALVVEQPDTIVYDYLDLESLEGVELIELRTAELGDTCPDKFIRLAARNFALPTPEAGTSGPASATGRQRRLSIWEHDNADERDRARSTWRDKPRTCEYVAGLKVRDAEGWPSPAYHQIIHMFAERWVATGNYLPADFDNPGGQPLNLEERQYQWVRGKGGQDRRPHTGHAQAAKSARRAEPGYQKVATDPDGVLLRLLDRHTREGRPLQPSAAHDRALERLKGGGIMNEPREVLFFWEGEASAGAQACLSNFYVCAFRDKALPVIGEVVVFHSVEQYMHLMKSLLAGDLDTGKRILQATEPRECRALGRAVEGYDDASWTAIARQVVERGVYLKFTQNTGLARYLVSTG